MEILFHIYLNFFFFNDTATTEIYTLSLHDALPIWPMTDVMLTTRPHPCLSIWSMKTLVQLKTPSRLIASTFRHEAWSILTNVLSELIPALLMRMSRWPNSLRTSCAMRYVSG